ncbi:MAG: tRNA (N6-isopentenyl adenosine(37)-C2)-methylthiotransferase MiaB [Nitrospirales bacterium]
MSSTPLLLPKSLSLGSSPTAGREYQVYMETFGCQMNEYDTELVRSIMKARGFQFTPVDEEADVILFNTCAIRENAHNRLYGHLARYKARKKERGLVIGVLGCMAQNLKQELLESRSWIDVLVGPDAYRRLPDLLTDALEHQRRGLAVDLSEYETYAQIVPDRGTGVNGWIAVMRGCDNFCSFCVVPYTRGRERSRGPEGILEEAHRLANQGVRQITLLGQNVNSYRSGSWDFARLLIAVADVPGIQRLRFTSPHPKDFPPALLEAVAQHPIICNQIHLPLQSANDRMLERMGRGYTRRNYLKLVDAIRNKGPIVLTTDLICGFCGETDEEFQDTYDLVKEMEYQAAFVFKYSERKHTIAARKYPDDIPEQVKGYRTNVIIELQKEISLKKNRGLFGKTVEVMIEGDAKKSDRQWMGHTEYNVTVVWPKGSSTHFPGELVSVTIHDATPSTLYGLPPESPTSSLYMKQPD